MEAVTVLVVVGFVAAGIGIYVYGRNKQRQVLGTAAAYLAGSTDESNASASGTRHGISTTFKWAARGSGKSKQAWTYIDCTMPPGYPLSLHLRPSAWLDDGKIERGELVDVLFGDAPFDEAFVAEGAPADVVRRMFDAQARAWLLNTRRCDVTTQPGGILRLAVRRHLETPETIHPAIDLAVRLAASVRDATAAADRAVPVAQTQSPYRPTPDDRPLQKAREARAAEVAALEATVQQRADKQKAAARIGIAVLIAFMAVVFAALHSR